MKNKNYHNSLLEGLNISDEYISVLSASLTANTEVVLHKHDWGQLNVINIGVMEININNEENLIAPWQYSVWIPLAFCIPAITRKIRTTAQSQFPLNIAIVYLLRRALLRFQK